MQQDPPDGDAIPPVPPVAMSALVSAVASARQARRLADVLVTQTLLAHWDAMVLNEDWQGAPVREGGIAERAFATHLGGLLHESRNRAMSMLRTARELRTFPASWAAYLDARFGWPAAQAIVRNASGLYGEARQAYDVAAAALAAQTVPQLLDAELTRLHHALDHDAATDDGSRAHRDRGVRARSAGAGQAELVICGPEFDIAAIYETAHTLAVAAHGKPGEVRTVQQLMYDVLLDLILGGMQVPPVSGDDQAARGPDTTPDPAGQAASPFPPPPAAPPSGTPARAAPDSAPPAAPSAAAPPTPATSPPDPPGTPGPPNAQPDAPPTAAPPSGAPPAGPPPGDAPPAGAPPGFWAGRVVPPNIDPCSDGSFTPATPFERIGDPRVPQRKVISAEILVTVPAATAAGVSDEPGKLAGWSALPAAEVRRIVAAARYWTRVETDPVDDAVIAFDAAQRTIPAGLRRLIWLRSETCDEPGCPAPAHRADIDHAIRVEHGGRTMVVNLSALCRPSHQTKDDGYMDVRRTPDGLVWRTKWGSTLTKKNRIVIRPRPQPVTSDPADPAPFDLPAA